MVNEGEVSSGLECKVQMAGDHGSKEVQDGSERGLARRINLVRIYFQGSCQNYRRMVCHCLKVGLALTVVSLFYYMRPLYESIGSATLAKGLNRVAGTFLAGALAIGAESITFTETVVIFHFWSFMHVFSCTNYACFIPTASAATFSRFIPIVKQRFDYGAMIFVLTFSLVSVSGYRVEELFELAHHRFSTVVLGTAICIFVRPVWAMTNSSITSNAECVLQYFEDDKTLIDCDEERSVQANFARWEPSHGQFRFQHPWNQYLKIGALTRNCAYCIEALNRTPLLPLLVKSETEITELIPTTQANTPLTEVLNLVTITSLLVEITSMTGFTEPTSDKNNKIQHKPSMSDDQELQDEMKILQQASNRNFYQLSVP
ncbi:hypothetical protein MKX03_003295 [Papaver bracteatum]|nr:hypothetical protein MKX03_003295 [Papaver bracteatum]